MPWVVGGCRAQFILVDLMICLVQPQPRPGPRPPRATPRIGMSARPYCTAQWLALLRPHQQGESRCAVWPWPSSRSVGAKFRKL